MNNRELLNTYNSSIDMPSDRVFITNNVPVINEKIDLLYEQVGNVDFDIDYDFQLQTHSYNTLVELANPLLATALRLRKLSYVDDISSLYTRMQNEIMALSEKVKELNYDSAFQLSFRYCVCTFIDEMVMATPWGSSSVWGQRSLLAHFHNETWGGEKFYSILSRTMLEPEKYHELLEFMYICLALGFKGQYALSPHGQENIQNILIKLQKELGLTYLFIAHDLSMVKHISDRVAVMYLGSMAELAESEVLSYFNNIFCWNIFIDNIKI